MQIKPFASLVGLALALTPLVMLAMPASQSAATAKATLVERQQASAPASVMAQVQDSAEACRHVRVVAAGYGEPVAARCAAPRS